MKTEEEIRQQLELVRRNSDHISPRSPDLLWGRLCGTVETLEWILGEDRATVDRLKMGEEE